MRDGIKNRNDIITELYYDGLLKRITTAFTSRLSGYTEDFEQFIYEIILNAPDEKITDLYYKNELSYYIYYIAKAQAYNDNSDFWKLYKGKLDIAYSLDDDNYKEKDSDNED